MAQLTGINIGTHLMDIPRREYGMYLTILEKVINYNWKMIIENGELPNG